MFKPFLGFLSALALLTRVSGIDAVLEDYLELGSSQVLLVPSQNKVFLWHADKSVVEYGLVCLELLLDRVESFLCDVELVIRDNWYGCVYLGSRDLGLKVIHFLTTWVS